MMLRNLAILADGMLTGTQWIMVGVLVALIIGYMMYRKKQV